MLVDDGKLGELIEAAREAGVEVPDLAPREMPSWYSYEGLRAASISMTDFGAGEIVVKLRGARYRDEAPILSESKNYDQGKKNLFLGALLAAYYHDCDGDITALADGYALPAQPAKPHDWQKWADNLESKAATRLVDGILAFRMDRESKSGN